MFTLLKRKFYVVPIVISSVVIITFFAVYMLIEQSVVSDYMDKITDVSAKISNDLKIEMDYVQYTSEYFIGSLLEKNDNDIVKHDFNDSVSRIRVYNKNIQGAAIYWENGNYSLSKSTYLKYLPKMNSNFKGKKESIWTVVSKNNEDSGYLFYLMPINDETNGMKGIALVDATSILSNMIGKEVFFENASVSLSSDDEKIFSTEGKRIGRRKSVKIEQKIKDNLCLTIEYSRKAIDNQLNIVKIYMIIFGILFSLIAFFVVHNMVKNIIDSLTNLNNKINFNTHLNFEKNNK